MSCNLYPLAVCGHHAPSNILNTQYNLLTLPKVNTKGNYVIVGDYVIVGETICDVFLNVFILIAGNSRRVGQSQGPSITELVQKASQRKISDLISKLNKISGPIS